MSQKRKDKELRRKKRKKAGTTKKPKTRPPTPMPWDDAPDVEWSCVTLEGQAVLAIQTTGETLSANLLLRPYNKVEVRFIFDPDRLPDVVPKTFICFTDGRFWEPILACDPDPLLHPLRVAITEEQPWWLVIQVVVNGKPHMRMYQVNPDCTTEDADDPGGEHDKFPAGHLWPKWIVKIG